jgi:hypothetical protein
VAEKSAPVIYARVLLQHGLADEAVVAYVARAFAFDSRRCNATLSAARLLVQQEAAARSRAGNC